MQSGVRVRQSVWSYLGLKHLANGHSLDELRARRSAPPSTRRFTLDGSPQLEAEATRLCERVLDCVKALIPGQTFEALVLGGGYGRGQGGVFTIGKGERLYNDIEFYVFLRGNRLWNERIYGPSLERLGERLSREAGLHVEFKVDSLTRFRKSPVSMFSYDLVSGHRILLGGESLFEGCGHHLVASEIPLHEATRLLLNRCSGLLLARQMLKDEPLTPEAADFVSRNLAKARLALGDALLAALGLYHWDCLERHHRLLGLLAEAPPSDFRLSPACHEQFVAHHAAGVAFKLHPHPPSGWRAEFSAKFIEVSNLAERLWLFLESRRLNRPFGWIEDYVFAPSNKTPEHDRWQNVLLNLRLFGVGSLSDSLAQSYPRARMLNTLPLLLWREPPYTSETTRHLQKQLRTASTDLRGFIQAFQKIWTHYG